MALLVVLVVVALLASLLTELAFSTMVDLRLTETFRDSTRAYYLAKGGINAGRMILQEDRNNFDALDETWAQGVANYPVGDGAVSIGISDQDGKLAINALVKDNALQTVMVDRCYRLFAALDLGDLADPAELTAALIDWVDADDIPFRQVLTDGAEIPVAGAEDSFYQQLAEPYRTANGPLETLDELALVRGFSKEVLGRVLPYLSSYDDARLNINTAPIELLMSLDQSIDRETAESVVAYRQESSIRDVAQLEQVIAAEPYSALRSLANLGLLGTTSRRYQIVAEAVINDGRRRLLAEVEKPGNKLLFLKVQ
jgi:general secretion pathway protein K